MKPEEVSKSIHKSLVGNEKPEEVILPNPEFLSQIDIAKIYKRELSEILKICAADIHIIAESCFYVIFNGNEKILRPSVSLARLIYQNFSNLRIELNVKEIQYKYIICEAVCFDLETNLAVKIPVYKSLLSPFTGKRYSEEQISFVIAQTNGIALRTAVFSVVPQVLIDKLLSMAIDIAKSTDKINQIADWFLKEYKINEIQILTYLNIQSFVNMPDNKLIDLLSIYNSVKDGELAITDIFKPNEPRIATETNDLKNIFNKNNNQ